MLTFSVTLRTIGGTLAHACFNDRVIWATATANDDVVADISGDGVNTNGKLILSERTVQAAYDGCRALVDIYLKLGLTLEQAEQLFIAKTLGATSREVFAMAYEFKAANLTSDANLDDYAVTAEAQNIAIAAEIENADTAPVIEIKTTKNGVVNFYLDVKRVKEADIIHDAIKNGATHYVASYLSMTDRADFEFFLSPITAYN